MFETKIVIFTILGGAALWAVTMLFETEAGHRLIRRAVSAVHKAYIRRKYGKWSVFSDGDITTGDVEL